MCRLCGTVRTLCKSCAEDEFILQGTKCQRKRRENESRPQDKGVVKGNNSNRRRFQNESVKQQEARNMVPNENHNKKIEIGEQRMSREGPKKKRCTKIEDAKRKKHERKAAETISA